MNLTIVIILNFCAILINGIPDYNRIVEMLLKDGPNVNNQNEDGRTALFRASQDGHTDAVEFLIKNGADINLKDKFGSSPLYAASESGYKRVVEILITNGALVNIKKKDGWTPLMAAAQEGHEQVIEVLHKNGANVNDQNSAEETALYVALSRVEFLLKNGLDVNLKTNKVWSIIHDDDIYHAHERILVLLLKNKANANLQNNMGKTPLYVAISAAGLSCKIASNDGTNEDSGFGDAIELLIRNGVNIPNQDGWSPLHQAIEDGCEKIVEILLRHGANVNMKNKNNDTANDLANRNGNRKIIELLSTVHPMRPSENACLQYSTDRILTGELVPDDEKPWIFVFAKQHFENRILNGELAENNEFPWMAALVYFNEDYKVSFDCGGTIISNKFVLTAAHCVTSRRRPILVRIGKVSLRNGNNDVIKATNHHIEVDISILAP